MRTCYVRVYMCVYVCMCMYASVVFKNGKGSFTQCILVHMHKGVSSWRILCEPTIATDVTASGTA